MSSYPVKSIENIDGSILGWCEEVADWKAVAVDSRGRLVTTENGGGSSEELIASLDALTAEIKTQGEAITSMLREISLYYGSDMNNHEVEGIVDGSWDEPHSGHCSCGGQDMTGEEVNNLVGGTWSDEPVYGEPEEAEPCNCGCDCNEQDMTNEEINSLVGGTWGD